VIHKKVIFQERLDSKRLETPFFGGEKFSLKIPSWDSKGKFPTSEALGSSREIGDLFQAFSYSKSVGFMKVENP